MVLITSPTQSARCTPTNATDRIMYYVGGLCANRPHTGFCLCWHGSPGLASVNYETTSPASFQNVWLFCHDHVIVAVLASFIGPCPTVFCLLPLLSALRSTRWSVRLSFSQDSNGCSPRLVTPETSTGLAASWHMLGHSNLLFLTCHKTQPFLAGPSSSRTSWRKLSDCPERPSQYFAATCTKHVILELLGVCCAISSVTL